jgi:hypothetical protein
MNWTLHVRLLQLPEASIKSRGLNPLRAGCVRFSSQPRKRTPERAYTRAYAITAAKTYAKGPA